MTTIRMNALAEGSADLRSLIAKARVIAGFTGAGISTESGVPDFRSPGSPWTRNKPIPFGAFVASVEARREAWRRKFAMDDLYRDARPSRGHLALASLVAQGKMPAIITQNIDGLHQASGIPADRIIELHGNGTYALVYRAGGATNSKGCGPGSRRRGSRRSAQPAAASSSQPPFRSASPCPRRRCGGRMS